MEKWDFEKACAKATAPQVLRTKKVQNASFMMLFLVTIFI